MLQLFDMQETFLLYNIKISINFCVQVEEEVYKSLLIVLNYWLSMLKCLTILLWGERYSTQGDLFLKTWRPPTYTC